MPFKYIQTFYVNPEAVNNSFEVMLTSVDLFFKGRPSTVVNTSGSAAPSVVVSICEVVNNIPDPNKVIKNSTVVIPYDRVNTSSNALTATTISFDSPVVVRSAKFYGIVIKYEDPAFDIWKNVQGDRLVAATGATNIGSPGSQNRFDGLLYSATNYDDFIANPTQDIKFKVNVAKFQSTGASFNLVNKAYEFLTIGTSSGVFMGGEWVYQNATDKAGMLTVSTISEHIIGTGTNFTNNHLGLYAVVSNGSFIDVMKIVNVTNATHMTMDKFPSFNASDATYKLPPVGRVYFTDYTKDFIVLVDSNAANSTFRFLANTNSTNTDVIITGERSGATAQISSIDKYSIDMFTPKFMIGNPSSSSFVVNYQMADQSNSLHSSSYALQLMKQNPIPFDGYVLSRSQEVVEAGLYGDQRKSIVSNVSFNVNVSDTNLFSVPYIRGDELDFFVYQNEINADTQETRYSISDYDTEVDRNGLGKSKYVSKKISFATNKFAEDLVVYVTGYRPAGTSIRVYAKIHNTADKDSFDDKSWTPLQLKDNVDRFSNQDDESDLVEYTYGLPQYPEVYENLVGTFVTTNGSDTITTTVDMTPYVEAGDLIRVQAPLIPENHEVFVVIDATWGGSSGTIQVNKVIDNLNVVGNVLVDKLKYKNTAWNNIANDNVARYVSSSLVEFDYFNTMQIKVVLLSGSTYIVPKVDQIQAVGVSA